MKSRLHQFVILGVGALLIISSSNINWGKEHWRNVLQADAKGYYAYLPSLVIDHDPNFGSFDRVENGEHYDPDLFYDYRTTFNAHRINKYFCGTALLQLPFFLGAHAYCGITDNVDDGYTKPYVIAINLAAIFWVLVGLWATGALLRTYSISENLIAFTLVAFAFGTNLFYYAVVAPGMSHAYSFGLCSLFLLVARHMALNFRPVHLIQAGALLGTIILVRPVNGMILLAIPIVFNTGIEFKEWIRNVLRTPRQLLLSIAIGLSIMSLQFIYYRIATGSWLVYSYGEEGFNWMDPHMIDILFSYKKGLFVYLPLLGLSLVGLKFLWDRSKWSALAWLAFFVVLTYVLSAWWNWWYGGSFGARPYVEYFGLFALLFGFAVQNLNGKIRVIFITTTVALIVLCQVQTYQARYFQIHWEDMTKDKYWDVFLRVDKIT
ncbi:MAG: hypothetical protein IPF95_15915 [Flavobacteriales bacterium]|nr:hypothetical protein [Flavobacteriales bacterium]MBK6945491.1 hypothetical protein [Flavobacteriales bacterium]MBK9534955.1 hypothetical protein [Flavobacteriales bacterium]MBP9138476.1 hypothetical protein [Flavobacteriales bacterium]HQV51293.1 hypothetical protein [Flavobacteriales bacterium]